MCGVILVDAGRSWSTNLGRDAYIHDHCLGYRRNYLLFYQLPNSNWFPHRMLFSREKPLVKSTAPGVIFYHIAFRSIFHRICFQIYYSKSPKHLLFRILFRSIYQNTYKTIYIFTEEGLTTPLTRWVARICSLCAGTVYVVLLGSPNGLIPWSHN